MRHHDVYIDIKECVKSIKFKKGFEVIKLIEIFNLDECDINVEKTVKGERYLIKYQSIQFSIFNSMNTSTYILEEHYDIIDENDNIVDSL